MHGLRIAFALFTMLATGVSQETKPTVVPAVWSVTLPGFSTSGGGKSVVHAMFTPDSPIVVTRVEVFDRWGPVQSFAPPTGPMPCASQAALELSDGNFHYKLPISATFLPNSQATYTDSGSLSLRVAARAKLTLSLVPPEKKLAVECQAADLKVVIQYRGG